MTQDDLFAAGEGDQWFLRNKSALLSEDHARHDPVLKLLDMAGLTPENILEVGASNGYRLHALHARFNCRVTAVEPSQDAIEDGQARYPAIRFLQGVASHLPIEVDGQFDLVIAYFVLHWIDRSTLLRSVAELDRVLKNGGHLIIGDFCPIHPEKVFYHHLPQEQVWTYKQDYTDVFLASNLYNRLAFLVFDHASHRINPDVAPRNRAQVALLQKTLKDQYQTLDFKP